jgi:hypothetical protein
MSTGIWFVEAGLWNGLSRIPDEAGSGTWFAACAWGRPEANYDKESLSLRGTV